MNPVPSIDMLMRLQRKTHQSTFFTLTSIGCILLLIVSGSTAYTIPVSQLSRLSSVSSSNRQFHAQSKKVEPSKSSLGYRRGGEFPSVSLNERLVVKRISKGEGEAEKEQYKLDDYLKFVEKRYNRLHAEELERQSSHDAKAGKGGKNMAWSWLTYHTPTGSIENQKKKHDDALEVLGLAELASKRVLQKHKALVVSKINKHEISDKQTPSHAGASVLRRLRACRSALLGLKLQTSFYFMVRQSRMAITYSISLVKKLFKKCLNRQTANKAMTGTLAVTLSTYVFLQPFIEMLGVQ